MIITFTKRSSVFEKKAQDAVASTKNSLHGVPWSGGLGDEIPHKNKIVSRETFLQIHSDHRFLKKRRGQLWHTPKIRSTAFRGHVKHLFSDAE